ncbi:CLAVATA3/ESR (CLE)-related protein 2-B [Zea mays]|uniref:Embryo surrounding region2 n=2 Tax=Zea mays TaxID=4577 RepID=A0A1D6JPZ1_MAIZE|nr:CLAVATA3/ESR (CLE)-related protein 2-B precursor [Zea mays]ONL94060.1 embryo surrounding region2 [Zea mays]PWZ56806.1 CLAVATA3/ESR (CLE)-related protein 2-B [Zea mays]|eukprot:NP_001314979.2 CLAVATA3/ESR (CLE)-related protein 2-B precursor [Zea mays]
MASRMGMVAILSLFVCALVASTSVNANVWQTDEDAFYSTNKLGVNGNMEMAQQQGGFIGHRPRLALFNRASKQLDREKRPVPSGPDPIHHSIPSHAPQHPPSYGKAPYEDDKSIASPGLSNPIGPPPFLDRY